jgi:hypothetical protein
VTVDRTGAADRISTSCGAVQPRVDQFHRGTWTVTLEYGSGKSRAESAPQTLEIP